MCETGSSNTVPIESSSAAARFAFEKDRESRDIVDVLGRILDGEEVVSLAMSLIFVLMLGTLFLTGCDPSCDESVEEEILLFPVLRLLLSLLDLGEWGSKRGEGWGERVGDVSETEGDTAMFEIL